MPRKLGCAAFASPGPGDVWTRRVVMRVLVISRPKFPPPQEMMAPLLEAFAAWRERHRPIMESFEFFISGGGGCGVINAPDDEALAQLMMEYPFAPFSDVELHPIMDGDWALAKLRAMFAQAGPSPA
jgi:hypothetical protein